MKKDGGPAFPRKGIGAELEPEHPGMTLRDWFAGQALAGIHASSTWDDVSHKEAANAAYASADAMLAEREKGGDDGR